MKFFKKKNDAEREKGDIVTLRPHPQAFSLMNQSLQKVVYRIVSTTLVGVFGPLSVLADDLHAWKFTGTIYTSPSPVANTISIGANFTATFQINYDLFPALQPRDAIYPAVVSAQFNVGSYSHSFSNEGGISVHDDLWIPGGDAIDFIILGASNENMPSSVHVGGLENGVSLIASVPRTGGGPFPGLNKPQDINLSAFDQRTFTTYPTVNGTRYTVQGTVDQFFIDDVLVSQVPEPSTWQFLGLASFIGIIWRQSIRRTK